MYSPSKRDKIWNGMGSRSPCSFIQTPEDHTSMFRQIIRFFRRVFQSKGFRTAAKIIFWILAGYFLFTYFYAIAYLMRIGLSFREAVSCVFDTHSWPLSPTLWSVAVGIVIGFMGYYHGRKKKEASESEDQPAEAPEPMPAQEEEIIETKHYTFR